MSTWFVGENNNATIKFFNVILEQDVLKTQTILRKLGNCIIEIKDDKTWDIFWTVGDPIKQLLNPTEQLITGCEKQ